LDNKRLQELTQKQREGKQLTAEEQQELKKLQQSQRAGNGGNTTGR
jgi:hypothetical protein